MSFFTSTKLNSNFIIASPRSGTTWLSKMLNAHPEVFCVERRLFGNYADFVLDQGQQDPRLRVTFDKYIASLFLHHGLPKKHTKSLTKSLLDTLAKEERKASGKNILVDKITPYVHTADTVIQSITTYFPKSKIVFLVRDGRDVLTSGVFHWFNKQKAGESLSAFEQERRNAFLHPEKKHSLDRFFQDKEIEQWAQEWAQPLRAIKAAQQHHEVKIVHYESILQEPENVLGEILSFFKAKVKQDKLTHCVAEASFQKMSQGRKKGEAVQNAHVRKGVAGDWKNYFTKTDAQQFQVLAGAELIAFGYEQNDEWINSLR